MLRDGFNSLKVDHRKRRTGRLNIPTDPCAGEYSEVETSPYDLTTNPAKTKMCPWDTQAYDAYLLRVEIGKNMNGFSRIQVEDDPNHPLPRMF